MRERTRAECVIMKSSVGKHYGCKSARLVVFANDAVNRIEIFPV